MNNLISVEETRDGFKKKFLKGRTINLIPVEEKRDWKRGWWGYSRIENKFQKRCMSNRISL